jgi:hypothetical protein
MQQSDLTGFNWFLGSAWEPISRGSASLAHGGKLEAQPPDLCSLLTEENWRQSLRICVTRQSLGTRIIYYKPWEL